MYAATKLDKHISYLQAYSIIFNKCMNKRKIGLTENQRKTMFLVFQYIPKIFASHSGRKGSGIEFLTFSWVAMSKYVRSDGGGVP